MNNILSLENVSRTYSIKNTVIDVFNDIHIDIRKTEKVAIVGPSGSGKTSILNIAGLIERPNSGKVFINDSEVNWSSDKGISELRKKNIGFVFQFNNLLSDFSILENVAMPMIISGMKKNYALEIANDFLKKVNLTHRSKNYPNQVSGGEQQRAAIARALINKPSLIIADEPTGNLDGKTALQIINLFDELVADSGCSLFLATHNLEIANLQDRVINIEDII
ncbi:MAG: ABC transporter ATP-binding protein [Pseudomonadota bacterium]|nr:ABC transporter ATP-binding protein [Pseudomonadota bacterium]MEC9414697.1 ABC transporter ATP-binding protein [Pseudomonadota bacterium]MEC9481560.1 ABC transporter ATP-binding protein [Pseudomonadota bacterium]